MQVQQIEQVVELERAPRTARTDADQRFQGGPVVDQAEADDPTLELFDARAFPPVPAHGIELIAVDKVDTAIVFIFIAENRN